MSEIQSLTLRIKELSDSVDFWNLLMLWGLGLAATAAVFVGIATKIVVTRSGQLAVAQGLLGDAKDRQLQSALRDKDVKIAEATKAAADEQLARVKLEAEVQPRTLSIKHQQNMADACSSFAGHEISVFSYSGDAESAQLAVQVMAALLKAKVRVANRVGAMMLVGGAPSAGIFISNIDAGLANTISKSLASAGILSTINPPRADEKGMTMTLGVKPYGLLK